jgi:hypothetical protein
VARAGDEDHLQVPLADHAVQVRVEEVQSWRRSPVTQQSRLDVLARQRLAQEWIVEQVDLPDRKVVGCAEVSVDRAQSFA